MISMHHHLASLNVRERQREMMAQADRQRLARAARQPGGIRHRRSRIWRAAAVLPRLRLRFKAAA